MKKTLNRGSYYLNRELSALQFNQHVLFQATDKSIPLLERLRFLFICCSNLDEFFEIRVAGVKEKIALNSGALSLDGLSPSQTLDKIREETQEIVKSLYNIYNYELVPKLVAENIHFLNPKQHSKKFRTYCENYFFKEVLPVLSPIGLDLAHPFPRLINKSLNFIVSLEGEDAFGRDTDLAIIHAPRSLPRVIKVPKHIISKGENFIFLADLIKTYTDKIFPGMKIKGCYQFRLTRNSDLFLDEEAIDDLAKALKRELRSRNYGNAVRLEIENKCPRHIVEFLLKEHNISFEDTYFCDGPVNLNRYMSIFDLCDRPDLKYLPFSGSTPQALQKQPDIFSCIRQHDIMLYHPYQSFDSVIDFIHQATLCPNVLAIKQTLYRIRARSRMVRALIEAARAGKEVTAIIELRARFDEESNLALAHELQQAGVLVLYGIIGYKIHAKMTLIVRKENNVINRYVHLGTGNYHEHTAKLYVDIGLLTNDKKICLDVQTLFHRLTGIGKLQKLNKIVSAPYNLIKTILHAINHEIKLCQSGKSALIILKVNGLTEKRVIQALYRASQAGVKVKLIVRGLCRLIPGIPGISDNIEVISVIGRFLEHTRIYYFKNNGQEKIYCASADLMERNLYYRVEICFPIESPELQERIKEEALFNFLNPLQRRWQLGPKGTYQLKGKVSLQDNLLKKYT